MGRIIEIEGGGSLVKILHLSGPHKGGTVWMRSNQTQSRAATSQNLTIDALVRLELGKAQKHGIEFGSIYFDEDFLD